MAVKVYFDLKRHDPIDVDIWCYNNIGERWKRTEYTGGLSNEYQYGTTFYFDTEDEAMLFRLSWNC